MFPNLVTYHIHCHEPLPPTDALAYQYVLAGNGLFVRAETRFFTACIPVAAAVVRGLPLLAADFRLKIPRLSGNLLNGRLLRRHGPTGGAIADGQRLVAAVAGHLVTEMVLARQVTVLGCYFSLAPPVMRSVPVTVATLAPFRPECGSV